MSLEVIGSVALALLLLGGTFLITHGHLRCGLLYMAVMQVPGAAYDVATHQYGFLLTSLIAFVMYLRGYQHTASGPSNGGSDASCV